MLYDLIVSHNNDVVMKLEEATVPDVKLYSLYISKIFEEYTPCSWNGLLLIVGCNLGEHLGRELARRFRHVIIYCGLVDAIFIMNSIRSNVTLCVLIPSLIFNAMLKFGLTTSKLVSDPRVEGLVLDLLLEEDVDACCIDVAEHINVCSRGAIDKLQNFFSSVMLLRFLTLEKSFGVGRVVVVAKK